MKSIRLTLVRTCIVTALVWAAGGVFAQTVMLGRESLVPSSLPRLLAAPSLEVPDAAPAGMPAETLARVAGAAQLASLMARGKSQGFAGILYENRDRAHSILPRSLFPGLAFLEYSPDLRFEDADYGLASQIVIGPPLIGNSSTALTHGPQARSLGRHAMTMPLGPETAHAQYASDSLYIYPEHRDHDSRDLYPANWPYTLTSQGSSSSDKPFLKALLMTLAAFPADTRSRLIEGHQIAPALQMILRRNLKAIDSDAAYMTALAHPSAFDGDALRPGRMIAQAAAMRPDTIPPMLSLRVEAEDFRQTAGLTGQSEWLFTTPSAVARVWHGWAWRHEMIVSADRSTDANGRSLRFHWSLLRGDPERVRIEPLDDTGSRARLSIAWHDDYPAPSARADQAQRLTARVDIGVFADNGVALSAPGFVSVSFPTHQVRQYAPGPDGNMRLLSIDYDAAARSAVFDPRLYFTAPWTDEMAYDAEGRLTGWTRLSAGEKTEFTADGLLADGRGVRYGPDNPALPMLFSWTPVCNVSSDQTCGKR